MPPPCSPTYPDGGSHDRYDEAVKMLISRAADEQEKAQLQALVIPEFLQERNEKNTSLSLFSVKSNQQCAAIPYGFSHTGRLFRICLQANRKPANRKKYLSIGIGRHPEQTHLADCIRSVNFIYKFFASFSAVRLATIGTTDVAELFRVAGNNDERLRITNADQFGGNHEWRARRDRYTIDILNPTAIREEGERIFANQQELQLTELVPSLLISLSQVEEEFENNFDDIDQATRKYLFSSGSESDKKLMDAAAKDYLNIYLGGPLQHVHLVDDLRSRYLQENLDREKDIVIIADGRNITKLHGYHKKLSQLLKIVPAVNLPTYMFHQYIHNLIKEDTRWNSNVDARVISRFLPEGGTIHRMKYGCTTNTLELHGRYGADDIAAACKRSGGVDTCFIYRYYAKMRDKKIRKSRT
eukprot:scaffold391_cov88-Skeletonema_dohrnii-CCMP3373.AAC.4